MDSCQKSRELVLDKILINSDVKHLLSQSTEICKASTADSKDITKRFQLLIGSHPIFELAYVAIQFDSRKEDLLLFFGTTLSHLQSAISKSLSTPAHLVSVNLELLLIVTLIATYQFRITIFGI